MTEPAMMTIPTSWGAMTARGNRIGGVEIGMRWGDRHMPYHVSPSMALAFASILQEAARQSVPVQQPSEHKTA